MLVTASKVAAVFDTVVSLRVAANPDRSTVTSPASSVIVRMLDASRDAEVLAMVVSVSDRADRSTVTSPVSSVMVRILVAPSSVAAVFETVVSTGAVTSRIVPLVLTVRYLSVDALPATTAFPRPYVGAVKAPVADALSRISPNVTKLIWSELE